MTNFDKIKEMTAKEFVERFYNSFDCEQCTLNDECQNNICYEGHEKWLEEEVKDASFKIWVNDYITKAFDKNDIDGIEIKLKAFGVDLSSSVDLTSACMMFQIPNDDTLYFEHMYWLKEVEDE